MTDPNTNTSIKQLWQDNKSRFDGLGTGSDYVAFQDIAGTSSIDFGFEGSANGYPAHSCYENYKWMESFGDPNGLPYHHALAQVWALLILEVADRPLLPFDLTHYGNALSQYVESLRTDAKITFTAASGKPGSKIAGTGLNLKPLEDAIASLKASTEEFHQFEDTWTRQVLGRGGLETNAYTFRRLEYNDRLTNFEADLLDIPRSKEKQEKRDYGIPGRTQFKHVVFGPKAWSGYDEAYFPAVRDMLSRRDWEGAQRMVEIAAKRIQAAGDNLLE